MCINELTKNIDSSWAKILNDEFQKDYFKKIILNLERKSKTEIVYPPFESVFNAFRYCSFSDLKVIIIGQDPYHQQDQADGLAFSVYPSKKITPSLRNIFKEIKSDVGIENFRLSLKPWAKQGVLLLNTTLTVKKNIPLSHADIGWQEFVINVIQKIISLKKDLIFVLWGKKAQNLISLLNLNNRTIILKSGHPSGLSSKYFFGCRHFSKINKILAEKNIGLINWKT